MLIARTGSVLKLLGNSIKTGAFLNYSTTMTKKALVILAPGAEEMEAVISIDVLRRGEINVTVAGLENTDPVKCSRGVIITPDVVLKNVINDDFDVIVLPGGLGGSNAMVASTELGTKLKDQETKKKTIAAICAAPLALKAHSICVGKNLTSYPAMAEKLSEGGLYSYQTSPVVVDENLITSRGPGTAYDFALTIVDKLMGAEKAKDVANAMLLTYKN